MTRDPFVDPQDDRLAAFFDEARAALVETPSPAVERRHLSAMVEAFEASDASRTHPRRNTFMSRIFAIGAAKALAVGVVALLATGSALAATGALPDPAQDAVANTVDDVGLDIPGGDDEENEGAENEDEEGTNEQEDADQNEGGTPDSEHGVTFSTTDCPTEFEGGNHGEYVSGTEERPRNDAAQSDCGKPVHPAAPAGDTGEAGDEQGQSAEHRKDGQEHGPSENGQEHGQGGPNGESSSGDGS